MTAVRDTLIVLNRRFLPVGRRPAYLYGVVQHAIRAAEILGATGARIGFILYDRCEEATAPVVDQTAVLGRFPGAVLRFHFRMEPALLVGAFREAVAVASEGPRAPVLYLQTSAVLPYVPPELDVVVTHHSPFVANVAEVLGPAGARAAFEWDHPKTDHLARMQAEGLALAAGSGNVRCGEISAIQETYLLGRSVDPDRVSRLPQPLGGRCEAAPLPDAVAAAVEGRSRGRLIAVTAVSRLDYFKNVELFVEGAVEGLRRGALAKAVMIGGFPYEEGCERLRALVPCELHESFVFSPRVARAALVGSLFAQLASYGVFVCSSRFDLVPYTALEAARSGLCTVVPDTGNVGAAEYLPENFQFPPSAEGLGDLFARLAGDGGELARFAETGDAVRAGTSDAAFAHAFERLCATF